MFEERWAMRVGGKAKGEESVTLLSDGMDLTGTVTFRGPVRVDGRLKGEIHATGTLEVGERGVVEGIVHARTLINSGTVKGTVTVTEKIRLVKPGILVGEVHTPCLAIEEGARFQGRSDMGRVPRQERGAGQERGNGADVEFEPVEDRQPEVQLVGGSP